MPSTHRPIPAGRDATLVAGRKDMRNSVATDANRSRKPKKGGHGRGNTGSIMDQLDDGYFTASHALDANDPNYDPADAPGQALEASSWC